MAHWRYFEPRFPFFPTAGQGATPAELGLPFDGSTIVIPNHNDVTPADAETYWTAVRTFIDQLTPR